MIFLQALWARVWPYIAALAALGAAVIGIRQSGKAAGRTEAKTDQLEADASARKKAREVDNKLDALDDDAIRNRARDWLRDNVK